MNDKKEKAEKSEKKQTKLDRQQVVILALSILCAALMVASVVFGIILAINFDDDVVPNKEYTAEQICDKVKTQVVMVKSVDTAGSGVVVELNKQKYIVTNHHVISSGDIKVSFYGTNEFVDATLMGFDAYHDIALLSFEGEYKGVSAAVIDESGNVKNGEKVLAVGNNLDSGIAFFDGIISKNSHMISPEKSDKTVPTYQITAPINAGMSGGGLFDIRANLIGINTYQTCFDDGRPVDGVSHSVPASIVAPIIRQILRENASGNKGQITNINVQNTKNVFDEVNFAGLNFRAKYSADGLKVTLGGNNVEMLGGAIEVGDIITKIGDLEITNTTGIVPLFAEPLKYTHNVDLETKNLQVNVLRNGKNITITYDRKHYKNY